SSAAPPADRSRRALGAGWGRPSRWRRSRAWSSRRSTLRCGRPVDVQTGHVVLLEVAAHERAQRHDALAATGDIGHRTGDEGGGQTLSAEGRIDHRVREDQLAVRLDLELRVAAEHVADVDLVAAGLVVPGDGERVVHAGSLLR